MAPIVHRALINSSVWFLTWKTSLHFLKLQKSHANRFKTGTIKTNKWNYSRTLARIHFQLVESVCLTNANYFVVLARAHFQLVESWPAAFPWIKKKYRAFGIPKKAHCFTCSLSTHLEDHWKIKAMLGASISLVLISSMVKSPRRLGNSWGNDASFPHYWKRQLFLQKG